MNLLACLQIYGVSIPETGRPEDEIESTVRYIANGPDYKSRVQRANSVKFTYLPPYEGKRQPRPMNKVAKFLNGEWRRHEWAAYDL
jgi:hypothetical protein